MNKEIWMPVRGFEGWYQVSNLGKVRRIRPGKATKIGRLLKTYLGSRGRFRVGLCKDGREYTKEVARLVANAFLGECPEGKEINHIDYDCANDRADNLEYISHSENIRHAYAHGFVGGRGEKQHLAKLSERDVVMIRNSPLGSGALSRHYGVSKATIKKVRNKSTWKHI